MWLWIKANWEYITSIIAGAFAVGTLLWDKKGRRDADALAKKQAETARQHAAAAQQSADSAQRSAVSAAESAKKLTQHVDAERAWVRFANPRFEDVRVPEFGPHFVSASVEIQNRGKTAATALKLRGGLFFHEEPLSMDINRASPIWEYPVLEHDQHVVCSFPDLEISQDNFYHKEFHPSESKHGVIVFLAEVTYSDLTGADRTTTCALRIHSSMSYTAIPELNTVT